MEWIKTPARERQRISLDMIISQAWKEYQQALSTVTKEIAVAKKLNAVY
jgi:hypothetical protein